MVIVSSGVDWERKECLFYMDANLIKNLEGVKQIVKTKDFDYVSCICGLPGLGKSTFAINCAKYLDPNFTIEQIVFTASEFIEKSEKLPKGSALILDESFASLNSKITMTKDFLRIINHLQIIRQRNLFIFLCLPNFFDLSKGIAIYRSHHLFVCYGPYGSRGSFAAYDRDHKKNLYILGQKFMNYHAVDPNFRGRFVKQKAINQDEYDTLKLQHLKDQNVVIDDVFGKSSMQRDKLLTYCKEILDIPINKLEAITGLGERAIYNSINKVKQEILQKFSEDKK